MDGGPSRDAVPRPAPITGPTWEFIMKKLLAGILPLLFGSVILLAGCENSGPAEQAGQGIDNAAGEVKDAVTPAGPVEKAGESVDNAAEGVKDAVTPDGPVEKAGENVDKAVNP